MEWHSPPVRISVPIFGQLVSDCVKPAAKASMAEDGDPPVVGPVGYRVGSWRNGEHGTVVGCYCCDWE